MPQILAVVKAQLALHDLIVVALANGSDQVPRQYPSGHLTGLLKTDGQ